MEVAVAADVLVAAVVAGRGLVDVGAAAVAGARGRGRTGEIVTLGHLVSKQAH
jgi:hypothetical protein